MAWTKKVIGGGSEKYLGSGYILKVEPTGFANRVYKGHERKWGLKNESNFWPEQLELLSAIDHQGQEGLGEDQEISFEHIEYEMPIQLSGVYTV